MEDLDTPQNRGLLFGSKMIYREAHFVKETLSIDGDSFFNCQFEECQLVYSAALPFSMSGNNFHNCKWVFTGAAQATLSFMYALYHGGMKEVVEQTIENIRSGNKPTVDPIA